MRIDDGHHLVVGLVFDDASQWDQTDPASNSGPTRY
jgi:hypothetical protein